MKDHQLKNLITDIKMLTVIYDLISFREKDNRFIYSDTYKELHESKMLTILKYTKSLFVTMGSFIMTVYILFMFHVNNLPDVAKYTILLIISIIYGKLLVYSKEKIKELLYQLKFKKAIQFAFKYYNYEQFVLFLDKYLSECSTRSYKNHKINLD